MKKLSGKEGFTLIELLVAIVLLMVGFLGVLTVLWTSSRAGTFSRQMTTAANLNEDIMEQISSMNYNDLNPCGFTAYTNTNVTATGFNREVMVQNDTPVAGTKTITVRIRWNDGAVTKTRTFKMLKRQDY